MTWRTAAVVVLALAASGCLSEPTADPDPVDAPSPSDDATAPTAEEPSDDMQGDAPDWKVGDWWSWAVTPRDAAAYEATTVVARVAAGDAEIGWTDVDAGLRSQFFHFVPAGPVSSELSWEGHHEPIDWFDFPLSDGKTWDGSVWLADLRFAATADEVSTPDGPGPGFRIEGQNEDGGIHARVDWSTDLSMFTLLEFYLFDDQTPWLRLDLLETGADHSGAAHLLHSHLEFATFSRLQTHLGQQSLPPVAQAVEVDPDVTHVAMGCYLGGAPGLYAFRFTDAAGTAHGCELQDTGDRQALLIDHGPVTPGNALADFVIIGDGSVFTELYLVTDEPVGPGA